MIFKRHPIGYLQWTALLTLAFLSNISHAVGYGVYISPIDDLKAEFDRVVSEHKVYHPNENLTITLGSGTHILENCNQYCLEITDTRNVSIEGENATKILVNDSGSSDKGVIKIQRVSNITLSNFAIDYEYKPFIQGQVTWVGDPNIESQKGRFSMRQLGGKQISTEKVKSATTGLGIVYDSQNFGVRKKDTEIHIAGNKQPNISYHAGYDRIYFNYSVVSNHVMNVLHRDIEVGDHFVYVARFKNDAIRVLESSDIQVENVSVNASPAAAILGVQNSGTQNFNSNVVAPAEGFVISSNGDGMHFQSSYTGINVSNNYIKGTADDGLAIYNKGMLMKWQSGAINPNSFSVDKSKYAVALSRVEIGHTLQFVDVKRNKILLNSRVEAISRGSDIDYIRVKSSLFDKVPSGNYEISIYNLSMSGSHSQIKNNVFDSVRRGGINLKSRYAIVQNNTFYNVDKWGIAAHVETNYPTSGPLPFGHIFSDNNFEGLSPRARGTGTSNIRIGSFMTDQNSSYSTYDRTISNNELTGNSYLNRALYNVLFNTYDRL